MADTTTGIGVGSSNPLTAERIRETQRYVDQLRAPDRRHMLGHDGIYSTENGRRSLVGMIASRLQIPEGALCPFEAIHAHKLNDQRYVVFLVVGGEPLMLEDGALFPSDALVTKLRLLEK